nr:transporter substrate-binding domain-containing protein [Microbacterium suwonense]
MSEFAAENCLSLDVTLGTAGGSQLALQEGQADLMVTMAIATPERKQVFNLSDRILFEGMGIVSSDGSYKTVEDLKGRQIGVQTGASWGRSFASCTAAMSSSTPISPPSAPT